jgi:hypothetical protein
MNGTFAKLVAKTDLKLYRKYLVDKREESAIPTTTEGALWYDEKCVTLLPKVGTRA